MLIVVLFFGLSIASAIAIAFYVKGGNPVEKISDQDKE